MRIGTEALGRITGTRGECTLPRSGWVIAVPGAEHQTWFGLRSQQSDIVVKLERLSTVIVMPIGQMNEMNVDRIAATFSNWKAERFHGRASDKIVLPFPALKQNTSPWPTQQRRQSGWSDLFANSKIWRASTFAATIKAPWPLRIKKVPTNQTHWCELSLLPWARNERSHHVGIHQTNR